MRSRISVAALLWCFSALAAVVSFGAGAAAPPYKIMHVLGDSLADNGNTFARTKSGPVPVPPPNLYFQGRLSNGPTAPERLWELLSQNLPGPKKALKRVETKTKLTANDSVNFAFGGAGSGVTTLTPGGFPVPGLKGQVALFIEKARLYGLSKKALFVIVVGSNDYLFPPPGVTPDPAVIVGNIRTSIRALYAAGGRAFMVLNLPDLGFVPLGATSQNAGALSMLSQIHNALLANAVTELRSQLAGARIMPVDLGALAQIPTGPGAIPALDDTYSAGASYCLFVPNPPPACAGVASFDVDPRYFFWDALHPTARVHRDLGNALFQILQQQ